MDYSLAQHEAIEITHSARWDNPDFPGSARIKEIRLRLSESSQLSAFISDALGSKLIYILEAYEEALNEDWLPEKILDIELSEARIFVGQVAEALNEPASALSKIQSSYERLAKG